MPFLTIAVPTFDRNLLLAQNLERLLPQLDEQVTLLLLDNASPVPVEETTANLRRRYSNVPTVVHRHRYNIGANANIVRCLELCDTPWLWILSDDDFVAPNAIQSIRSLIAEHPDLISAHFCAPGASRTANQVAFGLQMFLQGIDDFGYVLNLSNTILNAPALAPHLSAGYAYSYSMAPHFMMLVHALRTNGGRVLFRKDRIIESSPNPHSWSYVSFGLSIMTMLEAPIPFEAKRLLATRVLESIPPFEYFCLHLYLSVGSGLDPASARYYLSQTYSRLHGLRRSTRSAVLKLLFWLLLLNPRASMPVVRYMFKIARRESLQTYLDREGLTNGL